MSRFETLIHCASELNACLRADRKYCDKASLVRLRGLEYDTRSWPSVRAISALSVPGHIDVVGGMKPSIWTGVPIGRVFPPAQAMLLPICIGNDEGIERARVGQVRAEIVESRPDVKRVPQNKFLILKAMGRSDSRLEFHAATGWMSLLCPQPTKEARPSIIAALRIIFLPFS